MEIDWLTVGPIIAGVIGIIIGFIIGYATKKSPSNQAEIDAWKNKFDSKNRELNSSIEKRKTLEEEISTLQTRLSNTESDLASSKSKLHAVQNIASGTAATSVFNSNEAETHYGKPVRENDLTVIQGVDAEIASLLKDSGITTWKELAHTSNDRCRVIITEKGYNYENYHPATWPDQARLAHEGKWTELRTWQQEHHQTH